MSRSGTGRVSAPVSVESPVSADEPVSVNVPTRAVLLLLAAFGCAVMTARPVHAQSPEAFVTSCTAAGGRSAACFDGALTGRAMLSAIGLSAAGGNSVPGTSTTLGSRVGGGPRISPFFTIGRSGGSLPGGTTGNRDAGMTGVRTGVALGLFDGLRLMPTVGGFLSLDVIATGSVAMLSESDGFSGNSKSFGVGIRVGILREGFSVPGIAVSIARRYSGAVEQTSSPDAASVIADPASTSIRATIGKDAGGVEVVGGFGWDRVSGDVTIPDAGSSGTFTAPVDGSRKLYFAGASTTYSIVLSLSVEVGWATGHSPVTGYTGAFDAGTTSLFGSLSARFIL